MSDIDSESLNEQDVLDDEPKNILLGIIAQLRQGGDLHRIALPTFVLEPRSMLEKLADFMTHPDLLLKAHLCTDAKERFISVVRFYLAGFHIRPKGVKKPYNPVLGEIFRCKWQLADGSEAVYVAEQVSHHPPISAYFYAIPQHNISITGYVKPVSKFYGNSAGTLMKGNCHIYFTDLQEEYVMSMPNYYAKGILFGKMTMETGDSCTVVCEKNNLSSTIEFKNKGFFSGARNSLAGKVKMGKETVYSLEGKWTEEVFVSSVEGKSEGLKETLFKVSELNSVVKDVVSEEQQEELESRRLWTNLTKFLLERNHDKATNEKSRIENEQRAKAKARGSDDVWKPRFFVPNGDKFTFKYDM